MRRQNTLKIRDWGEEKSSLVWLLGKGRRSQFLWHFSSLASRRSSTGTIHTPLGKGKWQFECPTLGQNLQSFCLVFCGWFLDCTFRPNLIQVPGKKGCLLISESGVIPLGETERIYSLVARERLLWDASGVFCIPGLLIILFGEQRGRWEISPNESLSKWFYFWQGWYIQGAKHTSNILSKLSAPLKPRDVSNWFPHKGDVSH